MGNLLRSSAPMWSTGRTCMQQLEPIHVSPGTDSGTYDFFIEAVVEPFWRGRDQIPERLS